MSFCSISGSGGSNIGAINQTGNEARNVAERLDDVTARWVVPPCRLLLLLLQIAALD